MRMHWSACLLAILLLDAAAGRSLVYGQTPTRPEALIVPGKATNVQDRAEYDGVVRYDLPEPYPALQTLTTIRVTLEQRGWRPLSDDLWNPGLPSSHVRGWGEVVDENSRTVRSWSGEWKDRAGNVVSYAFLYRGHRNDPDAKEGPAAVVAIYLSAATADAVRRRLLRNHSSLEDSNVV
jgi:hypothetical protein